MGLAEVSNILWQERRLLELLQFKLDEQQLLLAAGRTRWLPLATHELDRVLEELRSVELVRAIEVDAIAGELGLGPGPSLSDLVLAADEPWATILDQHRGALLGLSDAIRMLAASNHELLARGNDALTDLASTLHGGTSASGHYTADGSRVAVDRSALLLDQAL